MGSPSQALPYTSSYDEALKVAVETAPIERQQQMAELRQRDDARQAHPTLDYLMTIYIGSGAVGTDGGKRLWTLQEGGMSWAQYRLGEVGAV